MDVFCVERKVQSRIPTPQGEYLLYLYSNNLDEKEHLALVMGQVVAKRFELLDDELFRSCFADWQGEHDLAEQQAARGLRDRARLRPVHPHLRLQFVPVLVGEEL